MSSYPVPRRTCSLRKPEMCEKPDEILRSEYANAQNGSRVVEELALWPGLHPTPECHQRRIVRHEARGVATGFDCRAGVSLYSVPAGST
jgi:hypothetical protein